MPSRTKMEQPRGVDEDIVKVKLETGNKFDDDGGCFPEGVQLIGDYMNNGELCTVEPATERGQSKGALRGYYLTNTVSKILPS